MSLQAGGTGTNFSPADWLTKQADILTNIANTLAPVQTMIRGASYLLGVAFIFKAIYSLKMYGEGRTMMSSSTNIKEPLMYFLVGAICLYFPFGLDIMLNTTFGNNVITQYQPIYSDNKEINAFGPGSTIGRPLTIIIQTIGYAAFIRGWVLVARAASQGQQPGATGKGLMHVVGGILAINIITTVNIINNTIYGVG